MPAKKALTEKASSLYLTVYMPDLRALISSSRMAWNTSPVRTSLLLASPNLNMANTEKIMMA